MDRREFLETVVVGTATTPVVARSAPGGGPGSAQADGRAEAVPPAGPRLRENFNRGWRFARQSRGTGALGSFDRQNEVAAQVEPRFREAHLPEYDDAAWEAINLPHTWNAYDSMDEAPGYWRGIGWYRKHLKLPREYSGKAIFLEFEAASSVAEFWLNGQRVGEHKGGYTSFELDVTDYVKTGDAENVLTVKVDNLFRDTLPPTVKTDYTFYGGIYRDVWLRVSEPTYVSDVFWFTPSVSEQAAELRLQSRVVNKAPQAVELTLVHEVAGSERWLGQKPINSRPDSASRSCGGHPEWRHRGQSPTLVAGLCPSSTASAPPCWMGRAGWTRSRIPWASAGLSSTRSRGFFLNGNRVQLQGTTWHQMYPGMGNALPNSRHVKDMELIRAMGVNFWRTSHYPHDPATMEASDRLGLMVWEELPINKEIGNPPEYIANCLTMANEMIRRDRNHPCIIVWGLAGEVNAPVRVAKKVITAVAERYRQLDPSRPVGMHEPRGEEMEALVDVVGLGVGKETDERHRRFPTRPYLTAEYAASTMGRGIYGGGPESEDLACKNHEEYLRQLNLRPWMAGGAIWHQFDYEGETYDTVIPHIVSFGMCDLWRIPKDVYYFYQSQWTAQAHDSHHGPLDVAGRRRPGAKREGLQQRPGGGTLPQRQVAGKQVGRERGGPCAPPARVDRRISAGDSQSSGAARGKRGQRRAPYGRYTSSPRA